MTTESPQGILPSDELMQNLAQVVRNAEGSIAPPEDDSPLARMTAEFHANSYATYLAGPLARSERIDVVPATLPSPTRFSFSVGVRFKRKLGEGHPVELDPGPVRGRIFYRPNLLFPEPGPAIAVAIENPGFFHPNFSRRHGLLCLGSLPGGPYPLDQLIEHHLYPILSYQVRNPSDPADPEAARYFALDPEAMHGLQPVPPLY